MKIWLRCRFWFSRFWWVRGVGLSFHISWAPRRAVADCRAFLVQQRLLRLSSYNVLLYHSHPKTQHHTVISGKVRLVLLTLRVPECVVLTSRCLACLSFALHYIPILVTLCNRYCPSTGSQSLWSQISVLPLRFQASTSEFFQWFCSTHVGQQFAHREYRVTMLQ